MTFDDIQAAVRKSLTDQCDRLTVLVNFCFLWINEKDVSFSTLRNSDAYHQLF